MLSIFLLFVLLPTLIAFWNFVWKRRGLPPGPTPLPILGNLLTLTRAKDCYAPYKQWSEQFGPIYTFWLGEMPLVAVTDYELMQQLFVKEGDAYAGREFLNELSEVLSIPRVSHGVIQNQGDGWKVLRRFGLQSMRNLGMGQMRMDQHIKLDLAAMFGKLKGEIEQNGGKDVNLKPHIDLLVGSTINRMLFGYAFDDNNIDQFYALKRIMDEQNQWQSTIPGRMLTAAPWLRHLPYFKAKFHEFNDLLVELDNFIRVEIDARIGLRNKLGEDYQQRERRNDILDQFLDQMEAVQYESGSNEDSKYFSAANLRAICFDIFLAGQETTATTMAFLVLYLLRDQRAQAKLHAELDGLDEMRENGNEPIGLAERSKLPYVNAVINEVQRCCNLLPLNLQHKTMRDVDILCGKYYLKEGTVIVPQISCLLNDEKIFPNPEQFLPERFLDENGQLKKCDPFAPFGMGKRICMGESLARTELFLFTANFFRNFKVLPVDPKNPPSLEKMKGFMVSPVPYNCQLVVRGKGRTCGINIK